MPGGDERTELPDDPLWYKDAIIYQTHVRTFHDSNGDGIGDFAGLTEKLDYLKDLGITALWLLPFYPSPLKDDGYDISDYTTVHPSYGTLRDFNRFLREAHRRGLRVITELVINHTSDQHAWFQRARRARKGSKERDFYVWSDSTDKYSGTRIIFKDFEPSNWSADPVAGAYYWHRFYSHQPDLNFDSPEVRKAIFQLLDLWMKRGIDGLRLDAVPYLYEREGTSCENLPETHIFLKELRAHIDKHFSNRLLLAEANQWPEDAVAYFGRGDECHMAFHFSIMPRLFMALRMENRFPIIDILGQTPSIPENAQWAMFLRNHDELTLEMVTDRERDYMYEVYARDREMRINLGIRRRLAPLLDNERRAIELMNSLLFSLPGTPVIYYGDEIGMGDNVYLGDRNGVRTPMQWSADRNAGFSRANPQRLYLPVVIDPEYHYEAVNVETQQNNPRSLLWWMKRTLRLRKQFKAFGRGAIEFLEPANTKALAFTRTFEDERILVVANLSRFSQSVQLDLSKHKDTVPLELAGETRFPPIEDGSYRMTLGPYAFFWFSLEPRAEEAVTVGGEVRLPALSTRGTWEQVVNEKRKDLERLLPAYLKRCRWFGGKARTLDSVTVLDAIRFPFDRRCAHILLLRVEYTEGLRETYTLPLTLASGEQADGVRQEARAAIAAYVTVSGQEGVLYDAMWDPEFTRALLQAVPGRRVLKGEKGLLTTSATHQLRPILNSLDGIPEPRVLRAEQSNTSVLFKDKLILKLFRRLEPGVNPDLEIGRFLTEKARFPNAPPVAGALEYQRTNQEPFTLGILHGFVANQGDAWQYTLDYLSRYYERAVARGMEIEDIPAAKKHLLATVGDEPPPLARELFGLYLGQVRLLGQRTAEFHLALASDSGDPDFAPEPFTDFYKQSQYQSMRSLVTQVFRVLRNRLVDVPEELKAEARELLEREQDIVARFRPIRDRRLRSMRTRTHGDYHLGQVLYTGKDFVLMDFEGEPARSLSERRSKTSPLRDVSGMLRSLHYASFASAFSLADSAQPMELADMEPWRKLWHTWASESFLSSYLEVCDGGVCFAEPDEMRMLLDAYLLEKTIYEIGYELNNRPDWLRIPMEGIREILEEAV